MKSGIPRRLIRPRYATSLATAVLVAALTACGNGSQPASSTSLSPIGRHVNGAHRHRIEQFQSEPAGSLRTALVAETPRAHAGRVVGHSPATTEDHPQSGGSVCGQGTVANGQVHRKTRWPTHRPTTRCAACSGNLSEPQNWFKTVQDGSKADQRGEDFSQHTR
jgi:hypothetical protein